MLVPCVVVCSCGGGAGAWHLVVGSMKLIYILTIDCLTGCGGVVGLVVVEPWEGT